MSRNLSPVVRRELANLKKDADSRKSAMKALKSYVKDLDSKAIPFFLAQVSDTKNGGSSGEYTISLYEVLARVHGPNIVSQIDMIMGTIIRTLAASAGSFPLQQACSKVVPAIARYAIEPSTPEDKKRKIIDSLCKPLSDSLICSQETLSCGAALCLKALVDCDNWRFASDEVVNEICSKLAGALKDKVTQTNSHMGLVMSLARRNCLTVEAYAGLYIQSGVDILNAGGAVEKNSQKRFSAIQMINFLMKCLDIRSIYPELELIIEEMEKCQSDQMPYVSGAAFEALQIARKLMAEEGPKFNSGRGRYHSASGDQSHSSGSPESQVLDSYGDYDSLLDSPIASSEASCNVDSKTKSVNNRKLWSFQNGRLDISLKDGIFARSGESFSELSEGSDLTCFTNGFNGFYTDQSLANGAFRSQTPSPQRMRSHINAENVKIYSTPRKLVRCLQDQDEDNTDFFKNYTGPSPVVKWNLNGLSNGHINRNKNKENCPAVEQQGDVVEKTLSSQEVNKCKCKKKAVKISGLKAAFYVLFAVLMALFALFSSVFMLGNEQEGHLVPT